jgi:PKD repeat protein
MLPFVWSINCQTGAYHRSSECFSEKFVRHTKNGHNAGAVGIICAAEVSYSFVNDTYLWGSLDNMWEDFMPAEATNPESRGIMPGFGNAAGKYFLKNSNWPYNTSNKVITYQLFHMLGDAFQCVYSEVPQVIEITHDTAIQYGSTTFTVQNCTDGALIALTVDAEIIATGVGNGPAPVVMTIPVLDVGTQVKVVATYPNRYRYEDMVDVVSDQLLANFSASATNICKDGSVDFADMSSGTPESWSWEFEGGYPATSTAQNPTGITYSAAGNYSVVLTVTKGPNTNTMTKTEYIHTYVHPTADFSATPLCEDAPVQFTDLTNSNGGTITSWFWVFGDVGCGGTDTSSLQNPTYTYSNPGTYTTTLTVFNNGTCDDVISQDITITAIPGQAALPTGSAELCQASTGHVYETTGTPDATSYVWEVIPVEAGTITGAGMTATLDLAATYFGAASVIVKGINECGEGLFSDELVLNILEALPAPSAPTTLSDTVDLQFVTSTDFTTTEVPNASSYTWFLTPVEAGTISGNGLTGTVVWDQTYRGYAEAFVKAVEGECEGLPSDPKSVLVRSTVGVSEDSGVSMMVYPNPNNGKFTVILNTGSQTKVNINIYNVLGNTVYTENNVQVSDKLTRTIDLSTLSRGIYHLKVEGTNGTTIRKIVIEK